MSPPVPGETSVAIDHVAHWVPDLDRAARALRSAGFVMTPYSEQWTPPTPGARPVPAGAANRCIMLSEGYIEVLSPTADTVVGRELAAGIDRYVGLHLIAFGAPDAAREHARLEGSGFPQQPLVRLSRQTEAADGTRGTLRFTVSRPQPGTMAEGRIQFVTHHTPELMWQPRYLEHPNGARALTGVILAVPDLEEAAARYASFTGCEVHRSDGGATLRTARGTLDLVDGAGLARALPGEPPPGLPFIAGYRLRVDDLDRTGDLLRTRGFSPIAARPEALYLRLPDPCGGTIIFEASEKLGTRNGDMLNIGEMGTC